MIPPSANENELIQNCPIEINSNPSHPQQKKKNRSLQFYKFLYYANKLEIQLQDFIGTVSSSHLLEIFLWVFSVILYFNTPSDFPHIKEGEKPIKYKKTFILLHLFHIARACVGLYLWKQLPRSFDIVKKIESLNEEILEKKLFNDIIRHVMREDVIAVVIKKKIYFLINIILTIINFCFDLIDIIIVLIGVDQGTSDSKVVLLCYMFIASLYIVVDASYFKWLYMIQFIFPQEYIKPFKDAFRGYFKSVLVRFKLTKPETDIRKEYENNEQQHKLPELKNQIQDNTDKLPELKDEIIQQNNFGDENNNNNGGFISGLNDMKVDL
jgi:hypothetical protein